MTDDVQKPSLLRSLVRQAPLVSKNFRLYFSNLYRRKILRTNIVAPYAAISTPRTSATWTAPTAPRKSRKSSAMS